MKETKKIAVILAGGAGLRAGGGTPKQLRRLNNRPVFTHSIDTFLQTDPSTTIVLVVNEEYEDMFKKELKTMNDKTPFNHITVKGGNSRSQSVQNALDTIDYDQNTLIAIHDAARPLVSTELIERGWNTAYEKGSAIPVIDLTDSIRHIDANTSTAVNRAEYKAVQTPQIFRLNLLKHAYDEIRTAGNTRTTTDDASVVELTGSQIHLYDGDPINIKITGPADIEIASILLNHRNKHI